MIAVNLFDDTFRHDICSVAGKTPRHVAYVRDMVKWDGITLFTDGYINRGIANTIESRYKIGWLHEPHCLHPQDYVSNPVSDFDFILTYYKPLLSRGHGYKFVPYGGVWFPRHMWGLRNKPRLVSMLVGDKMATEGHRLRSDVATALENSAVDFYGSRGVKVGYGWSAKWTVLNEYAFSIVTETCREDGLFTEWLLDCFAVGTIPVYWGCPNVSDFFDARGVLAFETLQEALRIVSRLDLALYRKLLPYTAANLRATYDYEITEDWIYKHVLEGLG